MTNGVLGAAELKELVSTIVVAQGNAFIKDLLRECNSRIGVTKDDFVANLGDAIDEGTLSQARLESWLAEVEGWGDQYLYVLTPPSVDPSTVEGLITKSPAARFKDAPPSLDFPDDLELKLIRCNDQELSMVWHQRKEGWNRWSAKDYQEQHGLDRVRFDAYRQRLDRSVVRFEWRYAEPYCAIMIQRSSDLDHPAVFTAIQGLLSDLQLSHEPLKRIILTQAIRTSAKRAGGVQSTRFEIDSGYVEMASTIPGGGIDAVEPVRVVLQSVEVDKFDRAKGHLNFATEEHGTSRSFTVEVFGDEAKLRIWAQCKREDVITMLSQIWEFNKVP
ncbi:hypothetical protein ACK1U3_21325 [Pseudomonas promysalinigenes]|uniref:hypothetical protein n=1 Tax=Pseudomonas promysalinigenes TaxID=485898 RepID=UPI00391706F8